MSGYVNEQMAAFGSAKVFAFLRDDVDAPPKAVERLFEPNPLQREAVRMGATRRRKGERLLHLPNLRLIYGTVSRDNFRRLKQDKEHFREVGGAPPVRPIRPLKSRKAAAPANVETSWGLEQIGIPQLWAQGLSGAGVRVGHLDTGIDATHHDLQDALAAFAEFDPAGRRVRRRQDPFDSDRHGTHSAGIIAARNRGAWRVGVAPGAQLISGIVIDGGDLLARVLSGIDWCMGQRIRVLNLSLGLPGFWDDFGPVIGRIRAKGILPVFAVGNEGPGSSRSPGNHAAAVSVGAIGRDGRVALTSSSQRFDREDDPIVPDVVMPGMEIVSTDAGGGYRADDGTSAAAPFVSGLAALLWEAVPAASVENVEAAIFDSCTRPRRLAKARANRGIPDAAEALEKLRVRAGVAARAAGGGG